MNVNITIPTTTQIQQMIIDEMKAAYGPDLNTNPNTPDGQFVSSMTDAFVQIYDLLEYVYSASKIFQAQDAALDDLVAFLNVQRSGGTHSTIAGVVITGVVDTVVPAGTEAISENGDIYHSNEDATIAGDGSIAVGFTSNEPGALICPIDSLQLVAPVSGVESITNPNPGVPGIAGETDAQLRARYLLLAGNYSLGFMGAIRSAILSVNQTSTLINDVLIIENDTDTPTGVPYEMPPNSLLVCIDYEDFTLDQQIGDKIFNSKPPITLSGYASGDEREAIVNDISGNTHIVTWYVADRIPLYVHVGATELSILSVDAANAVKQALVTYVAENSHIAGTMYYTKLLGQIVNFDGLEIKEFWIGPTNPPTDADVSDLIAEGFEIYTLSVDDINFEILP